MNVPICSLFYTRGLQPGRGILRTTGRRQRCLKRESSRSLLRLTLSKTLQYSLGRLPTSLWLLSLNLVASLGLSIGEDFIKI